MGRKAKRAAEKRAATARATAHEVYPAKRRKGSSSAAPSGAQQGADVSAERASSGAQQESDAAAAKRLLEFLVDDYKTFCHVPQPPLRKLKLGTRSLRDKDPESLTWTCVKCSKKNLPRRYLLVDLPVLQCDCGEEADLEFDFSMAHLEINNKCLIPKVKSQGIAPHCTLCATTSNIEATLQMRNILSGEETEAEPSAIDMEDILQKYEYMRKGHGYNPDPEKKWNIKTIEAMSVAIKTFGVVSKSKVRGNGQIHTIPGYMLVNMNFYDICRVLAEGYPLTTAFMPGKNIRKLKSGQIYKAPRAEKFTSKKRKVAHSIVLIGAGRRRKTNYYHFLNSWGDLFCIEEGRKGGFGMLRATDIIFHPLKYLRFEEEIGYTENLASTYRTTESGQEKDDVAEFKCEDLSGSSSAEKGHDQKLLQELKTKEKNVQSKAPICEQKLYTRAQFTQHMKTGDFEVDGLEVERSGFAGHPMCGICKTSFYGDNELYTHMSREHYSCFVCQRQYPGQYDYFRDNDDLEMHFRKDHFLCEDEACLAKKFTVFPSESEFKRHNAMEHGGRLSRAQKRNAALQIPTSFIYRRDEQDQRRGRGRGRNAHRDGPDRDISSSVRDGSATADDGLSSRVDNVTGSVQSLSVSSSSGLAETGQSSGNGHVLEEFSFPLQDQDIPDARMGSVPDETSFPSLSEQQSRCALALSQRSRGVKLADESLFPLLPGSSSNRGAASTQQGLQSLAKNTLASRLQQRSKGTVKVLPSAGSRPAENPAIVPPVSSSTQTWPTPDQDLLLSGSSQLPIGTQSTRDNGLRPPASSSSAWNSGASNKMKHSVSTPNLVSGGSYGQASSSTADRNIAAEEEKVRVTNKALVEKMRAALGEDKDRFFAFKEIAVEYRQGVIDTSEYLSYVEQFGISHLVPEMASLLPDPQKRRELADAYYTNMHFKSLQENGSGETIAIKESKHKKKGKGKAPDVTETNAAKDTVRKLQSNNKAQEGEAAVLSKDGYRCSKEKTPLLAGGSSPSTNLGLDGDPGAISKVAGANDNLGKGGVSTSSNNSKQSKKTSKFLRARLGDNSLATLDFSRPDVSPERPERELGGTQGPRTGLPVRSVWRIGAAQKLFSSNGKS